jgi:hypothetical protein
VEQAETEATVIEETDSGCQVDWRWLEGRTVVSATSTLDKLVITFDDGETLTVQASIWKEKGFLAFTPWKARS